MSSESENQLEPEVSTMKSINNYLETERIISITVL